MHIHDDVLFSASGGEETFCSWLRPSTSIKPPLVSTLDCLFQEHLDACVVMCVFSNEHIFTGLFPFLSKTSWTLTLDGIKVQSPTRKDGHRWEGIRLCFSLPGGRVYLGPVVWRWVGILQPGHYQGSVTWRLVGVELRAGLWASVSLVPAQRLLRLDSCKWNYSRESKGYSLGINPIYA